MCYCGDTRCWYCGPLQGNLYCEACGKWTDEGGCEDPAECDRIIAEAQAREDEIEEQIEAARRRVTA